MQALAPSIPTLLHDAAATLLVNCICFCLPWTSGPRYWLMNSEPGISLPRQKRLSWGVQGAEGLCRACRAVWDSLGTADSSSHKSGSCLVFLHFLLFVSQNGFGEKPVEKWKSREGTENSCKNKNKIVRIKKKMICISLDSI